ncbi:MAG TPA: S8 family serine peptidase, partial [candidate division Zixibacteria bacterium]|nr:S8 family serine peptidase [candidate division Zixibacteria bacterium]
MSVAGMRMLSIALSLWILTPPMLSAGRLAPELEERLQGKAAGEKIRVWIGVTGAVDPRALKAALTSSYPDGATRHREGMRRLKEAHGARQANVLGFLRGLEARGEAARVRPHWLGNIIEAELTPGQIRAAARRGDVDLVAAPPELTLIAPEPAPSSATAVGANLSVIKANLAWQAGYTGAGRLICSFDTGVDGAHPAIASGWKGLDGNAAAAWFYPLDEEPFPHTVGNDGHGTHVMGLLVGHDDATGDTVGVALDARWISAAVIDIHGAPIFDAFEWAVDPDGDPTTFGDVPDVVNHSWGIRFAECRELFYTVVENMEALGIVNIFAAGNEGSLPESVRNPADRALDSLDCFAVGNIIHTMSPPVIYSSSSRGPSPCTGGIKPNVCAPGYAVRSSLPGNTYGFLTGTSMAAPHVSGLVALLRQKNPNATPDQIKAAILTTAQDYTYSLPDNTYGWGVIDCQAALNALPGPTAAPNLRIWSFPHPLVHAGDVVTGPVILQNRGTVVANVAGTITGSHPALSVLDGSVSFGTAPAWDTVRSSDVLAVEVSDTVTEGSILSIDFQIAGSGYSVPAKLYFVVEPRSQRLQADHDVNNLHCTITNYGTYGLDTGSFFPANGIGFRTAPLFDNEVYESAFLLGRSITQVSDGARNSAGEPDGDFRVAHGGNIVRSTPGKKADQETSARFDDSRAENPIGLAVVQETYAFTEASFDDFIIFRYILTNSGGVEITGLRAGLYLDWDVEQFSLNAGGWDAADSVLWMAYNDAGTLSLFRGIKLLDGPLASAFTADASLTTYYGGGLSDGWTEAEKYAALAAGFGSAETFKTATKDLMQVLAAGPITMAA